MKPVIILGAGGHATVLISSLQRLGRTLLGVTCKPSSKVDQVLGVPILGSDDEINRWSPEDVDLVNGIGMTIGGKSARHYCADTMRTLGFRFCSVIDPEAVVLPGANVSEGAQVMAGAIIQPGVNIGKDAIVNTGVQIDHGCTVGSGSHLCPGTILAGDVCIGMDTVVGSGSVIIPGIEIGDCRIIRAGSVVTSSVI